MDIQYHIKYEDEQGETYFTTAESADEALEVRIQLIEDHYQNVKIEQIRV